MLVITRKPGQAIIIKKNVRIVFNKDTYGRVKVCIDAPKTVSVLRKELKDKGKREVKTQ